LSLQIFSNSHVDNGRKNDEDGDQGDKKEKNMSAKNLTTREVKDQLGAKDLPKYHQMEK
jgi:hypothetical protein